MVVPNYKTGLPSQTLLLYSLNEMITEGYRNCVRICNFYAALRGKSLKKVN